MLHPGRERGRGQIQLAGDGTDRLVFVEDQANGAFLELVRELPAYAPASGIFRHAGHRIHLSEDVHETGSSPPGVSKKFSRLNGNASTERLASSVIGWPRLATKSSFRPSGFLVATR